MICTCLIPRGYLLIAISMYVLGDILDETENEKDAHNPKFIKKLGVRATESWT